MRRDLLPKIHPRILVVRRAGDGLVHIGALCSPEERIQLLQSYGVPIDTHVATRPTPHAQRIVANLKRRFSSAALDVSGPWFLVEYERVLRAVGEYDLDTGERVASDEIALHNTVWVDGFGCGKVTGFAPCGRVEVTFNRTLTALVTQAPRNRVTVVA
jgi:hypothetical protein